MKAKEVKELFDSLSDSLMVGAHIQVNQMMLVEGRIDIDNVSREDEVRMLASIPLNKRNMKLAKSFVFLVNCRGFKVRGSWDGGKRTRKNITANKNTKRSKSARENKKGGVE